MKIRFVLPSLLLVLETVLLSPAVHAQGLPCTKQTVPVTVSRYDRKVVVGLTASDFRAQVHGRPATILSASEENSPRRILLLLDTDGNRFTSEMWKQALLIARTVIENLPKGDSVALASFSSQIERKVDFTSNLQLILDQLDDLEAAATPNKRRPAIWDSILEGLGLFDSPRIGDAIYVITDGWDNSRQAGNDDAQKALLKTGVRLFSLEPSDPRLIAGIQGMYVSQGGRTVQPHKDLDDVSSATGGARFPFFHLYLRGGMVIDSTSLNPTELSAAVNELNLFTHRFYRLDVELPKPVSRNLDCQFEVVDEKGNLPVVVRYPHKLVPCGASPGN